MICQNLVLVILRWTFITMTPPKKSIFPEVVASQKAKWCTRSPGLLASCKQALTGALLHVPSTGWLQHISQHDKWGRQSDVSLQQDVQPCLWHWRGYLRQRVHAVCPQCVSTAGESCLGRQPWVWHGISTKASSVRFLDSGPSFPDN